MRTGLSARISPWLAAAALLALGGGCATTPPANPQRALFDRLTALCGKAFAGQLVSADAADADMAGKAMVMHVNHCTPDQIRIPFHVRTGAADRDDAAWDRSRTWIITRTPTGLQLKHDHRHRDGRPDPVTRYGGHTAMPGTAARQEFPVDAESIALFTANGLPRSITNVWAITADRARLAYELRRTGVHARHFRVEFDLTRPVPPPPPAWGW